MKMVPLEKLEERYNDVYRDLNYAFSLGVLEGSGFVADVLPRLAAFRLFVKELMERGFDNVVVYREHELSELRRARLPARGEDLYKILRAFRASNLQLMSRPHEMYVPTPILYLDKDDNVLVRWPLEANPRMVEGLENLFIPVSDVKLMDSVVDAADFELKQVDPRFAEIPLLDYLSLAGFINSYCIYVYNETGYMMQVLDPVYQTCYRRILLSRAFLPERPFNMIGHIMPYHDFYVYIMAEVDKCFAPPLPYQSDVGVARLLNRLKGQPLYVDVRGSGLYTADVDALPSLLGEQSYSLLSEYIRRHAEYVLVYVEAERGRKLYERIPLTYGYEWSEEVWASTMAARMYGLPSQPLRNVSYSKELPQTLVSLFRTYTPIDEAHYHVCSVPKQVKPIELDKSFKHLSGAVYIEEDERGGFVRPGTFPSDYITYTT